jgi:hypothetical protein
MEEFASPIKRALENHPVYSVIGLSLSFFVYRWNANRVGRMLQATTSPR